MDRGTRAFWTLVIVLFAASGFFGVRAESVRRSVQRATAVVQTGDLLSFVQVQDGDTVLLANPAGESVTVRIVGIKAFDAASEKEASAVHAREAVAAIQRALAGKSIRAMLGTPPKDKHGRALATLYVDDVDVALQLVREGRVMVYTPFPFPAMAEYLREQSAAQAQQKGFWADPVAGARARAMFEQWKKGEP